MKPQKKAALISLFVSLAVLAIKFVAYFQTQSTAILSDAIETIVNVITAIVALVILKYALEPADKEHPYGHGKLEYFSAAFEGGIILFAAFAIIFESIQAILNGKTPGNILTGVLYMLLATGVNLVTGLYLLQTAKKSNSEALKASGLHLLSDVKTTAGVVVGLLLYKLTNLVWVDSAVAMLVGLWLCYEAIQIIKENAGGLLDKVDFESVGHLAEKINTHLTPEIIDIHNLRIIRSGAFHHIDAHLVVPQFMEIAAVHELIHDFEKAVVSEYKFDGEFAFHTDPCYQKYCRICEVPNCPVRIRVFEKRRVFNYDRLVNGPQHTEG